MIGKEVLTGPQHTKELGTQGIPRRENPIKHDNREGTERRNTLAEYWNILKKNSNILHQALADKVECIVYKVFLVGAGYIFNYILTKASIKILTLWVRLNMGFALPGNRYKIIRFRSRPVLEEATINSIKP